MPHGDDDTRASRRAVCTGGLPHDPQPTRPGVSSVNWPKWGVQQQLQQITRREAAQRPRGPGDDNNRCLMRISPVLEPSTEPVTQAQYVPVANRLSAAISGENIKRAGAHECRYGY